MRVVTAVVDAPGGGGEGGGFGCCRPRAQAPPAKRRSALELNSHPKSR